MTHPMQQLHNNNNNNNNNGIRIFEPHGDHGQLQSSK